MRFFAILGTFALSFCLMFSGISSPIYASAEYVKIGEDTMMYRFASTDTNLENLYFTLTPTYFAKILETDGDFYKVSYAGITGYILKEKCELTYSTPKVPYPENITFSVNASVSLVMRSIPSLDGKFIGLLPSGSTINFIGKVCGTEAISGLGNVWYYASFSSLEQGVINGYVYAPLTENLSEIPENEEDVSTPTSAEISVISPTLQNTDNLLVIGGLSLGGVILVLLLLIPLKLSKKEKLKLRQKPQLTYHKQNKIDDDNFDF